MLSTAYFVEMFSRRFSFRIKISQKFPATLLIPEPYFIKVQQWIRVYGCIDMKPFLPELEGGGCYAVTFVEVPSLLAHKGTMRWPRLLFTICSSIRRYNCNRARNLLTILELTIY